MSAEMIAAAAAASGASSESSRVIDLQNVTVNSSAATAPSANMQARFDAAMDKVSSASPIASSGTMPKAVTGMFSALDQVNMQAKSVSEYAKTAEASGGTMSPGEIVNLTMRCQEFMFQCQLTSNIANRSADGVQQLFRQQG